MQTELKPCPFCGGPAEVIGGKFPPIGIRYGVTCRGKCGTFLDAREAHQADAIRAWNGTRPASHIDALEARARALETALRALMLHSGIADIGSEDKFPEDLEAESAALSALEPQ